MFAYEPWCRGSTWLSQGAHYVKIRDSSGRTLDEGRIENLEVIELGNRGRLR